MKGFIQVYTGNGKGKTTAALGLALRAVGAGYRVFIGQFIKQDNYSEIETLKSHFREAITVRQYGLGCFIVETPTEEDMEAAQKGLDDIEEAVNSKNYDLVIMDEVNIATYYNLFPINDLITILKNKPKHVEVILTGRKAHPEVIRIADLVTEMKEIKHYYHKGAEARKGIEF
jgi:cob(I)alamin adenosyltransferase